MNVNAFIEKYYTDEKFKEEIVKEINIRKKVNIDSLASHKNEMKNLYENMLLNNIHHSFYPCKKEVKI